MKRAIITLAAVATLGLTLAGPATAESLLGDQSLFDGRSPARRQASLLAHIDRGSPAPAVRVESEKNREHAAAPVVRLDPRPHVTEFYGPPVYP